MPKKIVFCADGTWDDPNSKSNVCRLYTSLKNIPGEQLTTYDSGVGTKGNFFENLFGGAIGAGLFQKIKDGYTAISAQYQPGDQIFLFGFSRGAYTVRSLAGMISICGLPTVNQADPKCLQIAFEAYRNPAHRAMLLEDLNETYRMDDAKIQFLGVWDTVGSLGIPAIFGEIDVSQYGFLDTNLHPDVLNAAQALAIDEQRQQFQPALWTSTPGPNQTITQCWFAGVHCDVGGGYLPDPDDDANLSNITFLWMANYAAAFDLQFQEGSLPNPVLPSSPPDALASPHNSRTGLYRLFPPHVRSILPSSLIASSVCARCCNQGLKYTPENLHILSGQLANTYQIVNV